MLGTLLVSVLVLGTGRSDGQVMAGAGISGGGRRGVKRDGRWYESAVVPADVGIEGARGGVGVRSSSVGRGRAKEYGVGARSRTDRNARSHWAGGGQTASLEGSDSGGDAGRGDGWRGVVADSSTGDSPRVRCVSWPCPATSACLTCSRRMCRSSCTEHVSSVSGEKRQLPDVSARARWLTGGDQLSSCSCMAASKSRLITVLRPVFEGAECGKAVVSMVSLIVNLDVWKGKC